MFYNFRVGDKVFKATRQKDLFDHAAQGEVVVADSRRCVVRFADGEESVAPTSLGLVDPQPGDVLELLWGDPYLVFSASAGVVTNSEVYGLSLMIDYQHTPLRRGIALARVSKPYAAGARRSTRFFDAKGVVVKQGDIVRRLGPRCGFDDVVLWDYSKARWCLAQITGSRRLASNELVGLDAYPFEVVGCVHFIPPFEVGIPVDERLFPTEKLLNTVDQYFHI